MWGAQELAHPTHSYPALSESSVIETKTFLKDNNCTHFKNWYKYTLQ